MRNAEIQRKHDHEYHNSIVYLWVSYGELYQRPNWSRELSYQFDVGCLWPSPNHWQPGTAEFHM